MDVQKMADAAVKAVREYIEKREAALTKRIEQLERLVEAIPMPRDGKDGTDGKSFTAEDAKPIIEELIAKIEIPKGEKGDAGKDGKDGERGTDGTSVSMEDVEAHIKNLVDQIKLPELPELPTLPELPDIGAMVKEAVDAAVKAIALPQPRDGADGRDALDIEIIAEINPEKSYTRGIYARHNGGLFRSYETTKGEKGWECVVDGIASVDVEFDGERGVTIKTVLSSGSEVTKELTIPALIYRDFYDPRAVYKRHDVVQHGGSMWIALKDNPEGRPMDGESPDWRLSVKKGRDGAEVVKVAQAPKTVKLGGAA